MSFIPNKMFYDLCNIVFFLAKQDWTISFVKYNNWEQNQFDTNSQEDGFWYRIADVWDVKCLFYDEVDDAHEHAVEAEDDHRADGDIDNDSGSDLVSAAPKVYDGEDREETNDEIEGDVNEDVTLIDMPIKEDEAQSEGGDANEEIFFEVRFFQITGLAQYVSQEEERDTAH